MGTAESGLDGGRILLVDPSEKGALPIYTALVAEGLAAVGLRPIRLVSRHFVAPECAAAGRVHCWLPAERWPRPPGAGSPSVLHQSLAWLACAVVIVAATLALRPRVVHFQHPIHPRLDPFLLAVLVRLVPVVWTAHDVVPHDPSRDASKRARRLYALPQRVLVHSEPAARELARIADVVGLVVRSPVQRIAEVPDRLVARRRFGLDPLGRVAVAVGFIRAYKGYALIAETWRLLGDDAPELLVLGELVDESERAVVLDLQGHPRVRVCLGYATDADVVAAIAAADVVLLPHVRGSDSGSLHSARAVGTPVFSSDMAQLAEVVTGTGSGRVLPRDPVAWARALTGALPPRPPAPPHPAETGAEHLRAYRQARQRWQEL